MFTLMRICWCCLSIGCCWFVCVVLLMGWVFALITLWVYDCCFYCWVWAFVACCFIIDLLTCGLLVFIFCLGCAYCGCFVVLCFGVFVVGCDCVWLLCICYLYVCCLYFCLCLRWCLECAIGYLFTIDLGFNLLLLGLTVWFCVARGGLTWMCCLLGELISYAVVVTFVCYLCLCVLFQN